MTVLVKLEHPSFPEPMEVGRAPFLMRFVYEGKKESPRRVDVLDQVNDHVGEMEKIIVAERQPDPERMHIDYVTKRGQRAGENVILVRYLPVAVPPADDLVRGNLDWRAWCMERVGLLREESI